MSPRVRPAREPTCQPGVVAVVGAIADISNYVRLGTVVVDVICGAATPTSNPIPMAFESAEVDLTVPSTGTVIVPAVPGKQFVLCNRVSIQFRTTASAGSISTAPTTRTLNGANTWLKRRASFPLTTQFGGQGAASGTAPTASLVNTAVTVDVTVGATGTGGFAWSGKFIALEYYA